MPKTFTIKIRDNWANELEILEELLGLKSQDGVFFFPNWPALSAALSQLSEVQQYIKFNVEVK